ncbi:LTA synthase family protein [Mesobaculum littorinae]|uniref:sulfatase n=1 Tax=Mesobaculum littorinae TaxID=2486419 RepID=UPI0013E3230A|nr:sulfatase [Mesobaculum littorinae]
MTIARTATLLRIALALAILQLVIVLPSHPAGLTIGRFLRPTWELPVLLAAVALVPLRGLRGVVIVLALGLIALRVSNLGTYAAFSRPFNPLLDMHMLVSGWGLLSSSVGRGEALAYVGAVLLALAATGWLLWLGLAGLARAGRAVRGGAVALPALALAAAALTPGWTPFAATPVVAAQVRGMSRGVADLATFTAALREDPAPAPTFAALDGRDVILAFVESYGRAWLDDPAFAATSAPRLAAVEDRLARAGWQVRSGWAAAPTRGGQSWLSHGTLLSGLWVDSQVRYDRLMTSERASLNTLFRRAGWRTGAAMPAITLAWPEAEWYGYDLMRDAAGLGYAGQPFEWVTMPDQYSWSAMDRLLRAPGPDMVEMALVTSHAPWTPLPRIVPWDELGDGRIFDGTRRDGGTPREVWSDPATIRAQYDKALDYAVEVMGQYIARQDEDALIIVLGDHQPAPLLTGQNAPPDVPIHVMSRDPALLDRLPNSHFAQGMMPAPDAEPLPMQDFREMMTTVFETPTGETR